jgi:hypothetical protein
MAVVFAIFGIMHSLLFIVCVSLFIKISKSEKYTKKEPLLFSIMLIVGTLIGFFVTNHFAMNINDGSFMLALGYSIIPITQGTLLLLSYVLTSSKKEIKYTPVFLGICCSAPMTFLFTGLVGRFYWELLGINIYG